MWNLICNNQIKKIQNLLFHETINNIKLIYFKALIEKYQYT